MSDQTIPHRISLGFYRAIDVIEAAALTYENDGSAFSCAEVVRAAVNRPCLECDNYNTVLGKFLEGEQGLNARIAALERERGVLIAALEQCRYVLDGGKPSATLEQINAALKLANGEAGRG